jgi:hypothetical protein
MAKGKKRTNNSGGMAASKPSSRVAAPANTVKKQQQVVAVEQHAECHVNVAMSPAKGATDTVELKLTYSEEQAAPIAPAQNVPAAAAAVAPCTPPPTEPAVTADSNTTSSKQPAAAAPTATATTAVAKSLFLPPGIVSNFGRYFELAVQAYTYPVGANIVSSVQLLVNAVCNRQVIAHRICYFLCIATYIVSLLGQSQNALLLHAGILRSRRNCWRGDSSGSRGDASRASAFQESQLKTCCALMLLLLQCWQFSPHGSALVACSNKLCWRCMLLQALLIVMSRTVCWCCSNCRCFAVTSTAGCDCIWVMCAASLPSCCSMAWDFRIAK